MSRSDDLYGYDVDGVLVPRRVDVKFPCVIISGRRNYEWNLTIQQVGTIAPIYLRPNGPDGDHVAAANWKSDMIWALGVTEFYEDTEAQAAIIRTRCPQCRVVMVG